MWRSLWRSIDRFSLQHFKYVINELRGIRVVDKHNRELVVDLLQSIVEIVTYGNRQDPLIFECFMEYQVMAEFVRVLKISKNSRIEAPLLQYLSIMIQNMDSEHAMYYCLSNDYINSIIGHQYKFDGGDLAPYYISFLRAVSSKINRDTLCLLVKVHGDVVLSFPLYSEALKFAQHGEKMIQTAVRALTLNIYNVSDDMVFQFVSSPPASKYFSDLVHSIKEQCVRLDGLVLTTEDANQRRKILLLETDKIADDLYYLKDILSVGETCLNEVVTQNLLNILVFPILLPLLQFQQNDGSNISPTTSLYIISLLLQVVGGKDIINCVAEIILYPYMENLRDAGGGRVEKFLLNHLNSEGKLCSGTESDSNLLSKHMSSNGHSVNCSTDDNVCPERGGILALILSENHMLFLASLFLLLTLSESKDIDYLLASMLGVTAMQHGMDHDISTSQAVDGSILAKFMPQILNALLKGLASQLPIAAVVQWHMGWLLQKLLVLQGKMLDDYNLLTFNTSYQQSYEHFQKELDGCWFDYILDTLRTEWTNCRTALEKPSTSKDPFFLLEFAVCSPITEGSASSSYLSWQKMVDVVKVFILHLQLMAFITNGEFLESPLLAPLSSPVDSGKPNTSDLLSVSFGSEISLGSSIPCRIAFSNAGIRDIYLLPAARGVSGKLLLAEKHPFRSQRGVVFAIAPLAGLNPKIDADHPTWLHLRIREFDPRIPNASKANGNKSKTSNHTSDGRWTLGFSSIEACEAARVAILEEINKQRSSVRSALAPLLEHSDEGASKADDL
ncbi:protein TRANSPARENT TESTA 9-like [Euphorbia lathyris]|uniref:protein TRANSPARENT TESTA 9-like n=1 Tax=Euphorbia lathyris TaxID=212925 RepID=UPI003313E873